MEPSAEYVDKLRASVLERVEATHRLPTSRTQAGSSFSSFARLAIAAGIALLVGTAALWGLAGGGASIALADVVKVLNSVRTVTYDVTSSIPNPVDGTTIEMESKGYFQAPALERVESTMPTGEDEPAVQSVLILDCLEGKGLALMPAQKRALAINIDSKERSAGGTAFLFQLVQQLGQQGNDDIDVKVDELGEQTIDGVEAVGYRTTSNMADTTLWADRESAHLVRVEHALAGGGKVVLSNFEYDVDLDPELFSLQAPAGYEVQSQTVAQPTEADLVRTLRLVAEHNDGTFPESLATTDRAINLAVQARAKADSEKLIETPEVQQRIQELAEQYGEDTDGYTAAWMKEWTEMIEPTTRQTMQEYLQGVWFYASLKDENDSHYAGRGVKFGTADQPIFWYQPTGADAYRVIYGDLRVEEVTPAEAAKLAK